MPLFHRVWATRRQVELTCHTYIARRQLSPPRVRKRAAATVLLHVRPLPSRLVLGLDAEMDVHDPSAEMVVGATFQPPQTFATTMRVVRTRAPTVVGRRRLPPALSLGYWEQNDSTRDLLASSSIS